MSLHSPIGLDIGTNWIKAVQLTGSTVSAVACMPRREPDKALSALEAERIASVLDIGGFCGNEVVVAASRAALISAVIDVPPRTAAVPVGQIARGELARAHRRDPAELETAVWRLPGEPSQALAYGLSHAAAEALIKPLEAAGLIVRAIDLPMSALAHAVKPLLSIESAARPIDVIVDAGSVCLCIAVVLAGELVYERRIEDMKFSKTLEQIQQVTGLSAEPLASLLARATAPNASPSVQSLAREARGVLSAFARDVANEVDISTQYASTRYPDASPGTVVLAGGAADFDGLAEILASFTKAPVRKASLSALISCPLQFTRYGSMPALALGLARYNAVAAPVHQLEAA